MLCASEPHLLPQNTPSVLPTSQLAAVACWRSSGHGAPLAVARPRMRMRRRRWPNPPPRLGQISPIRRRSASWCRRAWWRFFGSVLSSAETRRKEHQATIATPRFGMSRQVAWSPTASARGCWLRRRRRRRRGAVKRRRRRRGGATAPTHMRVTATFGRAFSLDRHLCTST